MSPYRYAWASDLFDWMLMDPETVALVMAAGCVLGFAVVLWELAFYVQHRACWMQVRTLAGRRRLRQQRERDRAFAVGLLRRRLAQLECRDAD
jgi:uncharacterized membrane protein